LIEEMTQTPRNVRKLCIDYFSYVKRAWAISMLCKALGVCVGVAGVLVQPLTKAASIIVFVLAVISEVFTWQSDRSRGEAEALRRKLDYEDSLGWTISGAELSDFLARAPQMVRMSIDDEKHENYFASKDTIGAKRALKNVQESAWRSKHLAEKMLRFMLVVNFISVSLSVLLLLISVNSVSSPETLSSVGRVVISVLMLIFSLGLIRLTASYHSFSQKTHRIEERASEMIKGPAGEIDVLKLFTEYHLSRAAAPLLPDWVYERNKKYLNKLWNQFRPE
jgi:cell division protein FtsL